MKNIEQILSMLNHVDRDANWITFSFFCNGRYCRLINVEDENNQPVIELWIEYEFVATITEEWTENGEWSDKIRVFHESWKDFFNENVTYDHKYTICTRSEEVPDPT